MKTKLSDSFFFMHTSLLKKPIPTPHQKKKYDSLFSNNSVVRMSFPSFTKSDFSAFEEKKQKSRKYNSGRQQVWKKLKLIMEFIDPGLEKRGIHLQGKVSNYWPNSYNHFRVNGVWIGYSEKERKYYEFPHLSVGVYDRFIFIGFVINERAIGYQKFFADMIESEPNIFLEYFKTLNNEQRVIWYHNIEILGIPKKKELRELIETMREEWGWLSVGEYLSMREYMRNPNQLPWTILDVFEKLHPFVTVLSTKDIDSAKATIRKQEDWSEGDEYDEGGSSFHIPGRDIARSQAHKKLSRKFREWIRENHSVKIRKERGGIDVEFMLGKERVCVELKTESDGDVKTQIRDAMGQLFEYNYYPGREVADQWIIGTDTTPRRKDLEYIEELQELLPKKLTLIWESKDGFNCHPDWP